MIEYVRRLRPSSKRHGLDAHRLTADGRAVWRTWCGCTIDDVTPVTGIAEPDKITCERCRRTAAFREHPDAV